MKGDYTMNRFFEKIVNMRKMILILFLICFTASFFMKNMVSVNYDMNDYLPADTHSTVSIEVMTEEFAGGIPNVRIMVKNVTIPEALAYKEKIKQVEGVSEVTWLDDSVSLSTPMEFMDKGLLNTYYVDETALFSAVVDESRSVEVMNDLRAIIGEENALTGSAISTAYATSTTVKEVLYVSIFSVIFTSIVLLFTTTSWIEPVIVLVGLGAAILINGGTNLIFGEISFVTNAAGSILQLAVSLDYSVFLLHRFHECRRETEDVKEAMVQALVKSTSSILSSGLTTVIGFLALVLMQFRIGPDLGLALAKGVVISLVTVFLLMPALILTTYRWIDKTKHRSFMPDFGPFGRLVRKLRIPMVIVFLIVLVPSYLASSANSYYYGSSHILGEKTDYGKDTAAIEEVFGQNDTYVLLVPKGDTSREVSLSQALHEIPEVKNIISFVDNAGAEIPKSYLDEETLALLESDNYSRMVLTIDAFFEGEETFALVEKIRETADEYYPDTFYLAGEGVSTYDLMSTITSDLVKVNLLAILAVFIVLVLTMKNLVLPVILVLGIEVAIWLNLACSYLADASVFYIAYLIISSVQLGATVDYAILMATRYMENREQFDKGDCVVETIRNTAVSILTSGSALTVVGFLMSAFSTNGILAQLGTYIGRGALFSMAIVFFVLPCLLYLFDGLFIKKKKENEKKEVFAQ